MKNKRLIGIIAALAVLVAGSLIYSSMNKPEAKNEKKVAKVLNTDTGMYKNKTTRTFEHR